MTIPCKCFLFFLVDEDLHGIIPYDGVLRSDNEDPVYIVG